jgi:DNA polymerase
MARKAKKQQEETTTIIHTFHGSKEEQLQSLYDQWFKCQRCGLKDFRCTDEGQEIEDIVFCSGNPDSGVMIVGEAPGEEEMKELVPFVGRSGKLLNQILAATAADPEVKQEYVKYQKGTRSRNAEREFHDFMFKWREKNVFITNIVSCRPPENRQPIPPEIKACNERLMNLIYIVDPIIIIASGKTAAETLVNKKLEVTMKRGELFDMKMKGKVGELTYPVILTLHPSYLLRKADWNVQGGDYSKTLMDFMKAFRVYDFLMEKNFGIPQPYRGIS